MIEERFLTQTYTISNHPIREYDELIQCKYVKALGEFLCYITHSDKNAQIIYNLWVNSIIHTDLRDSWKFTPNFEHLKESLYVDKNDNKHNTIRLSLIFDCFYLAEKTNPDLLEKSYIFLHRKINGYFTTEVLKYVFDYFNSSNNGEKIAAELREHRNADNEFKKKSLKKVLVVATMSAGKSTLINALIGNKINKVASTVCTNKVRLVYNKQSDEGAILECAGPRYIYTESHKMAQHDSVENVCVHFRSNLANEHLCIIDTPGVNFNGDLSHGEITRNAVKANDYDFLLFVSNATQFLINDEATFLEYVIKTCKKKIIFCLNQCDRFNPDDDSIKETLNIWKTTLLKNGIHKPNFVAISAQWALLLRIEMKNGELTKSEHAELKSMRDDIRDQFYHLEQYCSNKINKSDSEDLLIHTGILNLESIIKAI